MRGRGRCECGVYLSGEPEGGACSTSSVEEGVMHGVVFVSHSVAFCVELV